MDRRIATVMLALLFAAPAFSQEIGESFQKGKDALAKAKLALHERVYDEGGIRVIERDDGAPDSGMFIDAATVIASSPEKKAQFALLLKAAVVTRGVPMRWSSLRSLDTADVLTLDEYMANLAAGFKANKESWEKAHPGEKYPFSDAAHASTRADLEQQLKGRDAVVLRYVHIKRKGE